MPASSWRKRRVCGPTTLEPRRCDSTESTFFYFFFGRLLALRQARTKQPQPKRRASWMWMSSRTPLRQCSTCKSRFSINAQSCRLPTRAVATPRRWLASAQRYDRPCDARRCCGQLPVWVDLIHSSPLDGDGGPLGEIASCCSRSCQQQETFSASTSP